MLISHQPLEDAVIRARMFDLLATVPESAVTKESWQADNYTTAVIAWMQDHPLNQLHNVNYLPHHAYSHGSVESIVSFISRHGRDHRLRFSQAEFVAAKIVCKASRYSWQFLENSDIEAGDAVLISMPFAGTGNTWPDFDQLLTKCDQLGVPVMLDLSYWAISQGITLDLSHPCIREVVFSLSKPIATQLRLGVRLSRDSIDDMIQVNSDLGVINRVAAWTGVALLQEFSIDWLLSKYLYQQTEVCERLGITPSATFTLAQGDPIIHEQYNRNGYNRICVTDEFS